MRRLREQVRCTVCSVLTRCYPRFTQPANLRTHVKKRHNYSVESNKQNKCEYCGEPHASIVGLHQHLLEDHPQQVGIYYVEVRRNSVSMKTLPPL